jgi:hypothetical protein
VDPPTLDVDCPTSRHRDEFLRGGVVGDEGGKKECGRMAREMGWIRRRWTKIDQLTDFAGGISRRKWNVETGRLTREDRRHQTNADSEQ